MSHAFLSSLAVLALVTLAGCGENMSLLADPMRGEEVAKRVGAAELAKLFERSCRLEYRLEDGASAEYRRKNQDWDPIFKAESPEHWRCSYRVTVKYTPAYAAPVGVNMIIGMDGAARMAPHSSDVRTDQEFFEMLTARAQLYRAQGR